MFNDADEDKHFHHITKGLKYHENTIGMIIRIAAENPKKAEETIKGLIEAATQMVGAMFPPDSVPGKILSVLEFETASDDERVSIAVKVKDDCTNFYVLYNLVFMDTYYSKINGDTTIQIGLKNDLHYFLKDQGIDVDKFVSEGLQINLNSVTNAPEFCRKFLNLSAGADKAYQAFA